MRSGASTLRSASDCCTTSPSRGCSSVSCAQHVRVLFLETHVSPTDHIVLAGYRGSLYRELGLEDTQSGLLSHSFWPTPAALEQMLADEGFRVTYRRDLGDTGNGPRVHLVAEAAATARSV